MNYKAGDTVICIDAMPTPRSDTDPWEIRAGEKYVVSRITKCCVMSVQLRGLRFWPEEDTQCSRCGNTPIPDGYAGWRFIKFDGLTETQTELEELTA